MGTILTNNEAQYFFIPITIYEKEKQTIKNTFRNFMVKDENKKGMVILRGLQNLPNKTDVEIHHKGSLTTINSCSLCEKRIKCTTNGFNCSSYVQAKPFERDYQRIKHYFKQSYHLIETGVVS